MTKVDPLSVSKAIVCLLSIDLLWRIDVLLESSKIDYGPRIWTCKALDKNDSQIWFLTAIEW